MRALMVVGLCLGSSVVWGQTLTRAPYLQVGTPNSVVVVWDTSVATNARVTYGNAPNALTQQVDVATSSTHHEVRLTNLSPATTYYYAVGTSTAVLAGGDAQHRFNTAPTPGSKGAFRAWVVGDSGTGGGPQAQVRDAMMGAVGLSIPSLFIHVGDMAYNSGTTAEFTNNFFGMYPNQLARMITWPAIGNHEGTSSNSSTQTGPYYDAYVLPTAGEAGGVPSGTEAYYSFDWANVHFIVLDSHESPRAVNGAMLTWMQQDAAATNQDWIVALWHHPPYTKGTHDSDTESQLIEMRENALPLLEAAGVDLVLAGHSHIYERSFLVDGAYATPTTAAGHILDNRSGVPLAGGPYVKMVGQVAHNGAVYVVAGHGGASLGGTADHPVMAVSDINYGSCVLDVQDNRLEMINIRSDGTIQDRFALVKGTALLVGFPVGGENLASGSNTTITWVTNGTVARVKVSVSYDGGQTWTVLAADVANTGSLPWTVPQVGTQQAMVRVEDVTNAALMDDSNGFFTIAVAPQTLIPANGSWAYNAAGMDLGTAWLMDGYDDSAWPRGNAQLGYGDNDEATVITRLNPTQPSYYFRQVVDVMGTVDGVTLDVTYDDGVTVWINGVEVLARNMGNGTAYDVFASAQSSDNATASVTLTGAGPFVVGRNVVAAMVKQVDATSSDVSFALQLSATVTPLALPDGGVPDAGGGTSSGGGSSAGGTSSAGSSGPGNSSVAGTSGTGSSGPNASSAVASGGSSRASSAPGSSGQGASSAGQSSGVMGNSSSQTEDPGNTPRCACATPVTSQPWLGLGLAVGLAVRLGRRTRRRSGAVLSPP